MLHVRLSWFYKMLDSFYLAQITRQLTFWSGHGFQAGDNEGAIDVLADVLEARMQHFHGEKVDSSLEWI